MKKDRIRRPNCDFCKEAGWVTLRLPQALTEKAKQALIDFLKRDFWEYGLFQWVTDADLRLIARRGKDYLENFTILRQWAEAAVKRIFRLLTPATI